MSKTQAQQASRIQVTYQGTRYTVIRVQGGYVIDGRQDGHGRYQMTETGHCNCPGYTHRGRCRHGEIRRLAEHLILVLRTRAALVVVRGRLEAA